MNFMPLPLRPDNRPVSRREQTPLEAAQTVRLLATAGLDPAELAPRTVYRNGRLEMRSICGPSTR